MRAESLGSSTIGAEAGRGHCFQLANVRMEGKGLEPAHGLVIVRGECCRVAALKLPAQHSGLLMFETYSESCSNLIVYSLTSGPNQDRLLRTI